MLKNKFKSGFTLIELLVVISIIGILVAIGLVSFQNATIKSRDARRMSDMKATQNAFEEYFSTNGKYGATCAAIGGNLTGGWAGLDDPKPGLNYDCTATDTTYCVCADLENDTNSNSSDNACGGGATKTHYCLKNLQ